MKRFSKLFACVGLAGLIFGTTFFTIFSDVALAASATWVDQSTISYNGSTFKEDDGSDNNWHFYQQDAKDNCPDELLGFNYSPGDAFNTQQIDYKTNNHVPGGDCSFGKTTKITLSANPDNWRVSFVWRDDSNIKTADGSRAYSKQPDGTFRSTSDGDCSDYLKVGSGGDKTHMDLFVRSNVGSRDDAGRSLRGKWRAEDGTTGYAFIDNIQSAGDRKIGDTDCHQSKAVPVRANASKASTKGTPAGRNGTVDNGGSCEAVGGALSWIMCPVLELMDSAVNALDNAVQDQLTTPDPTHLKGTTKDGISSNTLEETWGRLRNIALIILIPIMLVMVIGTAIGYSGLDAYTVKRAMPRLLIAVIFISLSWYITALLIRITNDVGAGTYGLLTGPFHLADKSLADMVSGGSGFIFSWGLIVGAAAAVVAAASIGIIFSLLLSAALGLFVGFCVLVLRNVFIYVLILLAPLAILAWIFPNNDRIWKYWWGAFSKLLIMYPMIMALIAAGKIFASIIPLQQGSGAGLFTNAAIVVAYIAPYFFIPATFKFAGGAFANITGWMNDRSRGAFDRLKKGRQERLAQNWSDFKAGDRKWRPKSVNRIGQRIGVGAGGRFGYGEIGQQALARHSEVHGADAMKDNKKLQQLALNNDEGIAIMALSGGTTAGAEQASRELMAGWLASDHAYQAAVASNDTVTMADIEADAEERRVRGLSAARATGLNHSNAQGAMTLMMQNKARAVGANDWGSVQNGIERLHGHGTAAAEDLAGTVAYFGREAGRADLGDASGAIRGFDRAGAYKTVRGHTAAVQGVGDALAMEYRAAVSAGDQTRATEAAAKLVAMRNAEGPDVSEDNKALVTASLQLAGIDIGDPRTLDQQFGAQINAIAPAYGPAAPGQTIGAGRISAEVRNRAGVYETGDPAARGGWSGQQPPGGGGAGGGAGGQGNSDIRLKTDIKHVSTLANGIKLYRFRYIWSQQVYVGVMAQDLLATHPEAVVMEPYGYYSVNYELLGLRMLTIEEWEQQPSLNKAK